MTSPGPAYKLRRPVENSYLVRERDRRRVRELLLVLLIVICLGGSLLGYSWIHLEAVKTGYRIDELSTRLSELTKEEQQLRLEAAFLASPELIERKASEELGMTQPDLDRVLAFRKQR